MFPAQQRTFYNPKTCNTYKEPRPLSPVFLGHNRQNPFKDTPERTERLSKVHKFLCTESVEAPGPTILSTAYASDKYEGPVFLGQNRQNPFKDTPERTERLSKVHKFLCTESVEAPGPTILLISSSTNRPAGTCDTYKGPRSLSPVFLGHNQQNPFKDTQVSTAQRYSNKYRKTFKYTRVFVY
jgi:hypothetical protein